MTEKIVKYHSSSVKILIDKGLVNNTWSFLDPNFHYVVITDTNLTKHYGKLLSNIPNLESILAIKPGEKAKSIEVYEKIITSLNKLAINRDTILIAFGGGVICELGGFVASTYLDGINYLLIPTTLVAQIDTAIGGHCTLNVGDEAIIGQYYHPLMIIVDPLVLKTLPLEEFNNGIITTIKYAIVKDAKLYEELLASPVKQDSENLEDIITRCLNIKLLLTLKDEYNLKEQQILSLGKRYLEVILRLANNKLPYYNALALGIYYELDNLLLRDSLKEIFNLYNIVNDFVKWNIDYPKYLFKNKKDTQITVKKVVIDKIGRAKLALEEICR